MYVVKQGDGCLEPCAGAGWMAGTFVLGEGREEGWDGDMSNGQLKVKHDELWVCPNVTGVTQGPEKTEVKRHSGLEGPKSLLEGGYNAFRTRT